MPYCDHENYCNKDKKYNIINLIDATIQIIGEYKMINKKQFKKEKHLSYNDIREGMIKETNVNRLQDNDYWSEIIKNSKLFELQKLRRVILKSKHELKIKDEIKTEFQTSIANKQEPNNKIEIKKESVDMEKKENSESKISNLKQLSKSEDIGNEQKVEYYKLEEVKLSVVDEIKYHGEVVNEQNTKEIKYNKPEQEAESLVVNDEQNVKQIEYSPPTNDMEVESSTIDDKYNMKEIEYQKPEQTNDMGDIDFSKANSVEEFNEMKEIEYHKSEQLQIDDMEGVEFPEINNAEEMEDVLTNFQLNEEYIGYINFIKARELYTKMFNDPLIERLQDGQYWSNEIDKLNYDYLSTNFKMGMHLLRQLTYNKKRDENEKKFKLAYQQTHTDENSQTNDEEVLRIEYPIENQ
jgi:hypothetical protein